MFYCHWNQSEIGDSEGGIHSSASISGNDKSKSTSDGDEMVDGGVVEFDSESDAELFVESSSGTSTPDECNSGN